MSRHVLSFVSATLIAIGLCGDRSASAAVIASDDFSALGSGVGWKVGDDWENLDTGSQRVNVPRQTGSFRELASPMEIANQVTYVRLDYQRANGNTSSYGLVSLYQQGGGEALAIGIPQGNGGRWAVDSKFYGKADSGIQRDFGRHTLIAEVDTTNVPAITYKLWVDSFDYGAPTAVLTANDNAFPASFLIDKVRMQANANQTDRVYGPLVIGTSRTDVGLVPEPASLVMTSGLLLGLAGFRRRRGQ